MNPTARRLLIFVLLALSSLPIVLIIPHYQTIYTALEPYHVEGLWVSSLGAYVLANLCTPGFIAREVSVRTFLCPKDPWDQGLVS